MTTLSRRLVPVQVILIALLVAGRAFGAEAPKPELRDFVQGFIPVDQGQLYYEAAGQGETVVLIHAHSVDCRMWDPQFAAMARRFRVIRYDLRGYGRSSLPREGQAFTHAEDLAELLRGLHVAKAHLVGLSLGAFVAGDFMVLHPDKTSSISIASGGVYDGSGLPLTAAEREHRVAEIVALQRTGVDAFKLDWMDNMMRISGPRREEIRDKLWRMINDWTAWQALHVEPVALLGRTILDRLALRAVTTPVQLLIGENDSEGSRRSSALLAAAIPGAKTTPIKAAGHWASMEQPEVFTRAVVDFIVTATEKTSPPGIHISADAAAAGRPLVHFWSTCVGAGRANEGLRASWLEQLKLVHEAAGFRYVRFHGLFHDDMFVYRKSPDGRERYNWQYVDDLFDRMLAGGVRPFVELGFFPRDLAGGTRTQFWWKGNVTPPAEFTAWTALVEAFVEHCRSRYGAEEVRQWYFEVWNEPNLRAFWDGTQAQYFELYRATALKIKSIDPLLRVGGPATSNFEVKGTGGPSGQGQPMKINREGGAKPDDAEALNWQPVWMEDFLKFCHENHLPVDFISTHPYPTSYPFDDGTGKVAKVLRSIDATRHDLMLLRKMVDASAYPKAEIHLTEWSSSPSSRDRAHDSLQAAAFVVKTNVESAGLVDSLSYWTFTDVFEEAGAGSGAFHGGFGLVNYQGIVKPTFHAYRFLHALGDEVLAQSDGAIVTRHRESGKVTALLYHYPAEVAMSLPGTGSRAQADEFAVHSAAVPLVVELKGLQPGARLLVETLDQGHGNAMAAWKALGSPESPTREQTAELRQAALATQKEYVQADAAGRLRLERRFTPWSLILIEQQ